MGRRGAGVIGMERDPERGIKCPNCGKWVRIARVTKVVQYLIHTKYDFVEEEELEDEWIGDDEVVETKYYCPYCGEVLLEE